MGLAAPCALLPARAASTTVAPEMSGESLCRVLYGPAIHKSVFPLADVVSLHGVLGQQAPESLPAV